MNRISDHVLRFMHFSRPLYQSAFPYISLQASEAQQRAIQHCILERGLVLASIALLPQPLEVAVALE
ncbi:MAG: hypothetical protein M3R04_09835, partial [bacterium]|nr:hypothetical protein [bacterium]